jgi:hypothetical protein
MTTGPAPEARPGGNSPVSGVIEAATCARYRYDPDVD